MKLAHWLKKQETKPPSVSGSSSSHTRHVAGEFFVARSVLTVELKFGMNVFGNSACALKSNQNWRWRLLPGGSLLVLECSSSLNAVCLNRLSFVLNFSSVHKHAELHYTYKRIDLCLMALRNRIIQNSLTQGRDVLFLWIGSRAPLIFPFMCKVKRWNMS